MNYWWVNQNGTYKSEVSGGFLWSPKTKSNGHKNKFYDFMEEVEAGDVVFSFCDTRIKAVGIATASVSTSPKPDFGKVGDAWTEGLGWMVPVEFEEFKSPIRPKDHIAALRHLLPLKYAPLQQSGNGLQSVYLAKIPLPFAEQLIKIIGPAYAETLHLLQETVDDVHSEDDQIENAIKGRTDIGETTKTQLVKARRGQGIFKSNVRLNEQSCRVTGLDDIKHLRASHIKPWAISSDEEKLNGCNGLLLSPHVDHLFDQGMISFSNDGTLLISSKLNRSVFEKWNINPKINVGNFNPAQHSFLKFHRKYVFKNGDTRFSLEEKDKSTDHIFTMSVVGNSALIKTVIDARDEFLEPFFKEFGWDDDAELFHDRNKVSKQPPILAFNAGDVALVAAIFVGTKVADKITETAYEALLGGPLGNFIKKIVQKINPNKKLEFRYIEDLKKPDVSLVIRCIIDKKSQASAESDIKSVRKIVLDEIKKNKQAANFPVHCYTIENGKFNPTVEYYIAVERIPNNNEILSHP